MGTLSTRTAKQLTSGKTSRKVFNSPWHADEPLRLYEQYPFAVGFSLRKIRQGNYNCLTIRRDSDSQERDIGFRDGLVDTAAIAEFCGSGSGFVRRWYDPSPNANHAVQPTAGLQPRIFNAGALEVNEFGKPAIRFIDTTGAAIGWHLAFDAWHTAAAAYVGHFSAYSLISLGSFAHILGSSPLDRGMTSLHDGSSGRTRAGAIRTVDGITSLISAGNGVTPLNINQTYVRHGYADRSVLTTFLDKVAAAGMSVPDNNANFFMPTKYWLGGTEAFGTVTADFRINEFLGYNTNQIANNLLIRSNMFDFWRS